MRRLSLLPVLAALLLPVCAHAQPAPPPPGLAATRPFVGVWEVAADGRRYDVHHAGPFLLWATPSDGSWVGSAYVLTGARGPATTGRFVTAGDGVVRLTLPGTDGVAPVTDAVVRRVADRPPPDVSLAATFCDPDALALPRPGLRRMDETGGLRGIGPRADLRDVIVSGLDLRGVDLTGADLRGAVLCGVDLSKARLAGARLDGAIVGPAFDGSTASLAAADLTGASLVEARIGGMDQAGAVFDRADLRGAVVGCTLGMVTEGCAFAEMDDLSIAGADLRGAHVPVWGGVAKGAETAHVDGVGVLADPATVRWLAASGLKAGESATLHPPAPFRRGIAVTLTGAELRALAPLMPAVPDHPPPGFDCRAARLPAERAVCATPELAARDRAVAALWQARTRTDAERTAQRTWLGRRNGCGEDANCLADAYAERLNRLAADLPHGLKPGDALHFSSEPPVRYPAGEAGALLGRWVEAWGEPEDDIDVSVGADGSLLVAGGTVGANGHSCTLDDTLVEAKTRLVTVTSDGAGDANGPLRFVLAGDVLVVTGAGRDFCGMRAGWSEVYYRRR